MKRFVSTYLNELKGCATDTGVMVFLLLVPLGYPLLYSYIYSHEVVRDIPIAVVDLSQSSWSREFLCKADATPEIKVSYKSTDMLSARHLMADEKVKGIILIPQGFAQDISLGNQAHVSIYCSMASLFYYKAMLVACTEVSLAMNSNIQASRMNGATAQQIKIATAPLPGEAVGISNPTVGFANFIIPAILVLIIQQILLLGIGMRMGTLYSERVTIPAPLSGHIAAYLTICMPISAYLLCIVPHIFGLSQLANGYTLAIFIFPYLLSGILFAITVGCFIHERETPMLLFVFTSVPLLFLSGISWPSSNIPYFWHIISYIFPSTAAINGFVAINSMGASLNEVQNHYCLLWVHTIIYAYTAYQAVKYRNRKIDKLKFCDA